MALKRSPGKVTVRYGGRILIEQGISLSSRVNALSGFS
jgi:hypothetical protein